MKSLSRIPKRQLALGGSVWFSVDGAGLGDHGRIALLRAIGDTGSITQAAKVVGLSYKGAWDIVEDMNQVAGRRLAERGGTGLRGGGTRLTEHGRRLVERFEQIEAAHRRFMTLLDDESADLDREFSMLKVLNMKTSVRNQFVCTIVAVRTGAVNDEVELALPAGTRIAAILTHDAVEGMALRAGMAAVALIDAPSVMVSVDEQGPRISARNQLPGTVRGIKPGAVNAEVQIELEGGGIIVAMLPKDSVRGLRLAPRKRVTAFFQSASVIVAVAA